MCRSVAIATAVLALAGSTASTLAQTAASSMIPTPAGSPLPAGPATVSGRAWYDDNANGIQDSGEAPAVGAKVTVSCMCYGKGVFEGTDTVRPDGSFSLSVLASPGPQLYSLSVIAARPIGAPPVGGAPNYGTSIRFLLSPGQTVSKDAGLVPFDERYFPRTVYRINNDAFWSYFNARGGVSTFGYPLSRQFTFLGTTVQFFQREVMQQFQDGSVHLLNVLDPDILPFQGFNFSTFPAPEPSVYNQAPAPDAPNYASAVLSFVQRQAPNSWNGLQVNFYQTFSNTVTLQMAYPNGGDPALIPTLNLEIWGVPTSEPAFDPNNRNFVYLRFQRGIMQFDASCNCTHGILLAQYLKAIITGENLPVDLRQEAANGKFYLQYDPTSPRWLRDPRVLPSTDLTEGFDQY